MWAKRLGWLALLWCGGVLSVAALAYLIRLFLRSAGMTS
jgi:hypothetical protein